LVPTLLHLCGFVPSAKLQGRDLGPLLSGVTDEAHRGVALEYHSANWGEPPVPLRGWRSRDWKYVEERDGPAELYDLRTDPGEISNLVRDPAASETRERLRRELREWMTATGDTWPEIPRPAQLVEPERPKGN
jgi:arylsulfatase A-like enzyme